MAIVRLTVLVCFIAVAIGFSMAMAASLGSKPGEVTQRNRRHTGNCPDANYVEKHYIPSWKLGPRPYIADSSEEEDATNSPTTTHAPCIDPNKNFVEKHNLPASKLATNKAQEVKYSAHQDFSSTPLQERLQVVDQILSRVPLIDGHNDFPHLARKLVSNQMGIFNFKDLRNEEPWMSDIESHTDLVRLRQGKVGAQFWVAYVPCASQHKDAVSKTYEQIDFIHRLVEAYPEDLRLVNSAQELTDAFSKGFVASLIGVEGGHSIGNSLANVRNMYKLGVRYLTLTHGCTTPWADNSELDRPDNVPVHDGLSAFGEVVVQEMNRIGMMVDLSHVSQQTMKQVLNTSSAPVIFSHSSALALCDHVRNVGDDVLTMLAENGGIIMVNFYSKFVSCNEEASLQDVVQHMNHIRTIAGVDVIGIGADYNGVKLVPKGLEDVSKYPMLFAELLGQGWTPEDIEKVAGKNFLRVFRRVEEVRDNLINEPPNDVWIPLEDMAAVGHTACVTYP